MVFARVKRNASSSALPILTPTSQKDDFEVIDAKEIVDFMPVNSHKIAL
jgi:hypothetical protein